jgi:hypothetical protein
LTATDARAAGEELTLVPESAAVGDKITVSGSGWLAGNGPVYVFSDASQAVDLDNALTSPEPDDAGTISSTLAVPNLDVRAYRFFACQVCVDSGDGFPIAYESFEVTKGEVVGAQQHVLLLDPSEALADRTVTASGTGWAADLGDVSIFASEEDSLDPDSALQTAPPDGNGSFSTTLTVPGDLPPGSYLFYACQSCGDADGFPSTTREFEILKAVVAPLDPTLTLDPEMGAQGDSVQISGSGWSSDRGEVLVFTDQSATADPDNAIASAVPDEIGTFETEWTVTDDLAATNYELYACQACDDTELLLEDTASFTVNEVPVLDAQLLLDPRSGEPGDSVTVSGTGWSPEAGQVSIFSDVTQSRDQANALIVAIPDDNGVFTDTLRLPDLSEADYQFYACQACGDPSGLVSDEAAFTIRVLNPPNNSGSNPPIALIVGGILLLLLAAAAAATAYHYRKAFLRRPYLRPRPDPAFEVQRWPADGPSLPRVRLVPHDDEAATTEVIEVRR